MAWERVLWVDDDGSLTVGTEFDADRMNNIEDGIEEAGEAIDAEATARGAADTAEETARKAADKGEKEGREAADALRELLANKDTDTTLAANSDTKYPSQKAVKAYIDGLLASSDAVIYKGAIDCSANPNFPAANAGHLYRVSVAGKIGGASGTVVEVGDTLLCNTDGTAAGTLAEVGSKWNVIQANIDGAVVGPASAGSGNLASYNGTTGKVIKDSGLTGSADGTFASATDQALPTAKAVKTYVDAEKTARIADVDAEEGARKAADTAEQEAREAADAARPPVLQHDAATLGAAGTGLLSIEHTPVTARPKAVIVMVAQNFLTSIADQVINVSYGEQLMTRVGTSFVSGRGAVYVYMLTGRIKPGKQTALVTVSGAASKRAMVVTLAGPSGVTPKIKVTTGQGTSTTPILEAGGAVWDERVVYSLLSGVQNPAAGAGQTELGEHEFTSAAFAQWDVNKENAVPGKTPTATYGSQTSGNYMGVNLSVGFVKEWGLVTELPPAVACAPGDTCSYVADNTNGVIWQLLYDGEGEYPWKKIGGAALRAEDSTARLTTSATFQTTGSPSITAPVKMTCRARFGARGIFRKTGAPAGIDAAQLQVFVAGVGSGYILQQNIASQFVGSPNEAQSGAFNVAASGAVQVRYAAALGNEMEFVNMTLEVDPIRVG